MAPLARLRIFTPWVFLFFAGCSRTWLPEKIENNVGKLVTQSVLNKMPEHHDSRWQKYIEDMGREISAVSERKDYHYRFYIVDSPIVNAFAVPDGSVFVTTGLLNLIGQDPLALAGVLAHEIGHIARRHGAETIQRQLGYAGISFLIFGFKNSAVRQAGNLANQVVDLGYGREMELEADLCAVRYLARLGYAPDVSIKFLRSLLPLERGQPGTMEKYLRSHPPTQERIRYVEEYIRRYIRKNPS